MKVLEKCKKKSRQIYESAQRAVITEKPPALVAFFVRLKIVPGNRRNHSCHVIIAVIKDFLIDE